MTILYYTIGSFDCIENYSLSFVDLKSIQFLACLVITYDTEGKTYRQRKDPSREYIRFLCISHLAVGGEQEIALIDQTRSSLGALAIVVASLANQTTPTLFFFDHDIPLFD